MLLLDEIGNIGNEMMGSMASMIRSIGVDNGGVGMLISGQSETDLKRIGDTEYDGEQIKANLAIKYYLSLSDKYYAETASEQCGDKWKWSFNEQLVISKSAEADMEDSMSKDEVKRYPKDYFLKELRKATGEGIIIQDGFAFPEKIVCRYVEPKPAYAFRLMRNISHEELMSAFTLDKDIEVSNNENYEDNESLQRA